MQSILNKRVFRNLRKHWFRYIALFFLIVMVMSIVVAMISSAESVIKATDENHIIYNTEDGYFQTFIPLSSDSLEYLDEKGITVEEQSYIDFAMTDGSTVRVYKLREQINLTCIESGEMVEENGELVIEKLYAGSKELADGSTISLGSKDFLVTGICSSCELEAPRKNATDSSADCTAFGYALVTADDYAALLDSGEYENSEVYNYSFLLNDNMTYDELEDYLCSLELDREAVTDIFFLEMLDNAEETKNEITDGIQELTDGTGELSDGMSELADSSAELIDGADTIFKGTLESTQAQLAASGFALTLTEDNFEEELTNAAEMAEQLSPAAAISINTAKESLIGLKEYRDGVAEYADGVSEASEGSTELADGVAELKEKTDEIIDEYFTYDLDNLTAFVKSSDNANVSGAAGDVKTTLSTAILAGVILLILITYVISIFILHSIDRETTVIGALYALGVKRKQLMLHYLMLPVAVTLAGGIVGTLIGFSPFMMESQIASQYEYYSIPSVEYYYPLYMIIYGMVVPPVIAVLVNYIVIRKKLSAPVLGMLRNQQKQSRAAGIKVKSKSFIRIFRIRQTFREMRSCIAVVLGMFISLLVLMLGLDTYCGCNNVAIQNKEDTHYNYMYLYKYTVEEVPEGGEAAYSESLKKQFGEYNFSITFCGIDDDNKYFDFDVPTGENLIALSSSAAIKYSLNVGDKLVVTDEIEGRDYAFTVDTIVDYSVGMYAFMDINSMRELFDKDEDYFNTVFSDEELDIDAGRLYSTTTRENVEAASDIFVNLMQTTFMMLMIMSAVVFLIVMYLMIKVMIDRSAQNIALMKVFGYRKREVRKLYLDGNFVVIAVSALICIPLSKMIIDRLFPSFVENVPMGMDLSAPWYLYVVIYAAIILCYLFISTILSRKLNKVAPAEILKNRE